MKKQDETKDVISLLKSYEDKNKSGLLRIINRNPSCKKVLKDMIGVETDDIAELVYAYYNQLKEIPCCPYCQKPRKFISLSKGYSNTCGSSDCKHESYSTSNKEHRAVNGSYENVGRPIPYRFNYSEKELWDEFTFYETSHGSLGVQPKRNKIIKQFQQDVFYAEERKLLKKRHVREKLFNNRERYLGKTSGELTPTEVYNGFKISGIHKGYSHFSPLWMKYFAERCGADVIYDPCGGWGHHMLGVLGLGIKYIYNDFSPETAENFRKIVDYFGINHIVKGIYQEDARSFVPEDADEAAWFMCPPYYNIEVYNGKKFKNIDDYADFLNSIFHEWACSNSKCFGIIMKEEYLKLLDCPAPPDYSEPLAGMGTFGYRKKKNSEEYLYIWCKN